MNLVRLQHAGKIAERAKAEIAKGELEVAWKLLEEAHIFAQPFAALHLYIHWEMMLLAFKERNFRETWGQIIRLLLAVPGSWSRQYPVGNTGRSNVNMFTPMPLSKRISDKITELNKLEKRRIENGGEVPKYQRKHPVMRD